MTTNEFLSAMKSRGAVFTRPATRPEIATTNMTLQNMRMAMLPAFITQLYEQTGGINLDTGYIFGPVPSPSTDKFRIPTIVDVNHEISHLPQMLGKTVFGRNDLFWFAFDAFGTCMMLDNLTLKPIKKYDDPYRAMTDCLIAGKF